MDSRGGGQRGRQEGPWQEGSTVRLPVGGGGGPEPPRRRWKTFARRAGLAMVVPVVAAIVSLLLEYGVIQNIFGGDEEDDLPSLAGPSRAWDAKPTSGDVVGVHAVGNVWPQRDGGVFVAGTVADTKPDGFSAKLKVEAIDSAGRAETAETLNTDGHGKTAAFGATPGVGTPGHLFRGDVRKVRVIECLSERDDAGRRYEEECGSVPAVVWSARS